ncbi:hypothetical protein KAR48_11480 [bacterium]|nr:hypothetical protein [bacterium]
MYDRIITHDDFDGIISAALASNILKIDRYEFAGPRTISDNRFPITESDVVCDLPCPSEVGLWFDHHAGNVEDLSYLGRSPEDIPGRFDTKPSCARVVFEHFTSEFPERFTAMVDEADRIDSFDWHSIEDWRAETPGKVVDGAIKLKSGERRERFAFLARLVSALRDGELQAVSELAWVRTRYDAHVAEEISMKEKIERDASFLDMDTGREIVILDRTHHKNQDPINKNLAYLIYSEALAVIEIKSRFRRGIKTNDIAFSMSLSLNLNEKEHGKDVGEIMRRLNIGDGHKGAGAGTIDCASKDAMLTQKDRILNKIFKYWKEMPYEL